MSAISPYTLDVPLQTLRRAAERVLPIAERHAGNEHIAAGAAVVVPRAQDFATKHGLRERAERDREHAVRQSNDRVAGLARLLRSRIPVISTYLERDVSELAPDTDVAGDVFAAVTDLVAYVREHGAEGSLPVAMAAEIEAEAAATRLIWLGARERVSEAQRLGQEVREAAEGLHQALVMFRRVLAAELGRRHADYRALRYVRRKASPEQEDEAAAQEAEAAQEGEAATKEGEAATKEGEAEATKQPAIEPLAIKPQNGAAKHGAFAAAEVSPG